MSRRLPNSRSLALLLLFAYLTIQWILVQSPKFQEANENPAHLLVPNDFHALYSSSSLSERGPTPHQYVSKIDLDKEILKGLDYARSIKSTKRKLLFVHIPKAAGTTIEEVGGLQAKLAWGSCLFNHRPRRRGNVCRYPRGQFEWPTKVGYWHLPTQLFPLKGLNPYEGADLFAVVRDPYERLLSEFYYICRRKITKNWDYVDCNRTRLQEPEYMNQWLQTKLEQIPIETLEPQDYLSYNGHFTPQSQFLVSYPAEIRMVDYVLTMDNLAPEFNALMKSYGIVAEMLVHKKNAARNGTDDLDARHFDAKTLALLHERYSHDLQVVKHKRIA